MLQSIQITIQIAIQHLSTKIHETQHTSSSDTFCVLNGNDSFQVATSIHDPLNDGTPCRALTNAETSSRSALDSVEFPELPADPAVWVSYQISPAKVLSMSAQ